MPTISREDFNKLHEKVDDNAEALARIEGKIDGIAQQKGSDWQSFGVIGAIVVGIWNMLTK